MTRKIPYIIIFEPDAVTNKTVFDIEQWKKEKSVQGDYEIICGMLRTRIDDFSDHSAFQVWQHSFIEIINRLTGKIDDKLYFPNCIFQANLFMVDINRHINKKQAFRKKIDLSNVIKFRELAVDLNKYNLKFNFPEGVKTTHIFFVLLPEEERRQNRTKFIQSLPNNT